MNGHITRLVFDPFEKFINRLLQFLPNLLLAVLLLVTGVVIGLIADFVLRTALSGIGLDRRAERWGLVASLRKWGISSSLSEVAGRVCLWLIIVLFAIVALDAMSVLEVDLLLSRFFLYLPSLFVAIVIVVAGLIFGNFLGRAALVWSVNAGLGMAAVISAAVRFAAIFLSITMALEQLGVAPTAALIVFSILLGGLVLGLAIAFGLGGEDMARQFLEKRLKENRTEKDRIDHL